MALFGAPWPNPGHASTDVGTPGAGGAGGEVYPGWQGVGPSSMGDQGQY